MLYMKALYKLQPGVQITQFEFLSWKSLKTNCKVLSNQQDAWEEAENPGCQDANCADMRPTC